jgi:hypothetical protein
MIQPEKIQLYDVSNLQNKIINNKLIWMVRYL